MQASHRVTASSWTSTCSSVGLLHGLQVDLCTRDCRGIIAPAPGTPPPPLLLPRCLQGCFFHTFSFLLPGEVAWLLSPPAEMCYPIGWAIHWAAVEKFVCWNFTRWHLVNFMGTRSCKEMKHSLCTETCFQSLLRFLPFTFFFSPNAITFVPAKMEMLRGEERSQPMGVVRVKGWDA